MSDHLYTAREPEADSVESQRHEPFVLLSAVGAVSDGLDLSLLVANVGHTHPALILRQFAELAFLYGGRRVYAGLGAGWNAEEFDSLGLHMPSHEQRARKLQETLIVARSLFDTGVATFHGEDISVAGLPLSPRVGTPPRLAVGGGSARVIQIAAQYADHLDFDAPSHRLPLTRTQHGRLSRARDVQRRLLTTDDDMLQSREILLAALREAGRPADAVTTSINVTALRIGAPDDLTALLGPVDQRYAIGGALQDSGPATRRSPFVLTGSVEDIATTMLERGRRLGLAFVVLPDGSDTERVLQHLQAMSRARMVDADAT